MTEKSMHTYANMLTTMLVEVAAAGSSSDGIADVV
jgi:hypothetical protein